MVTEEKEVYEEEMKRTTEAGSSGRRRTQEEEPGRRHRVTPPDTARMRKTKEWVGRGSHVRLINIKGNNNMRHHVSY